MPDTPIAPFRTGITGINHNDLNAYVAGGVVQLPDGDWSIGLFFRHLGGEGNGYLFNLAPSGYTKAQCVTGNNTLSLWDNGNSGQTDLRYRLLAWGRDKAGNAFGTTAVTIDGGTNNAIYSDQMGEPGATGVTHLVVVRRRAGFSEIVLCNKGQTARVVASVARTWTGFNTIVNLGIGGRCVNDGSGIYNSETDSPFVIGDYALTDQDIERICNGEDPATLNPNGYAIGRIGFFTTAWTTFDQSTLRNPTNGQFMTLNGQVVTFVSGTPVGSQVQIGADVNATLDAAIAYLNGLTPNDPANPASFATYSKIGSYLRIQARTPGLIDFAYDYNGLCYMPRVKKLSQAEAVYLTDTPASTSGGNPLKAYRSGPLMGRFILNPTWNLTATEMAPVTPKAGVVRIRAWTPGMVCQQKNGFASLKLSGTYSGNAPSGVEVQVLNKANGSVVKAWAKVTNFVIDKIAKTWSGDLAGVPATKAWLVFETRKATTLNSMIGDIPFGVGEVILLHGQSLQVGMVGGGSDVVPNGYTSKFAARSPGDNQNGAPWQPDGVYHRAFSGSNMGSGESALANLVSDGLNCPVAVINLGLGGTSLAILNGASYWNGFVNALATTLTDPASGPLAGYFCWDHGHADAGGGYGAKLDALYANLRAYLGDEVKFLLTTLANIQSNAVDNTYAIWLVRQAQRAWLDGKAADPMVLFGGDTDDYTTNTSDGVHPTNSSDYERKAERMALCILKDRGAIAFDGAGPKIASVTRSGATITVHVEHNGGTNLQSRAGSGDVTGFDVSSDNFASLLTISSAQITGPSEITLTLSADPGAPVGVMYNFGRPGKINSDPVAGLDPGGRSAQTQLSSVAQSNPVYDDRAGLTYNTGGLPLQFTTVPVVSN